MGTKLQKKDESVKSRFGIVAGEVLESDLPLNAKGIYSILTLFADKNRNCFPSLSKIQETAGISRNTLLGIMKLLETRGVIIVTRERGSKNYYQLQKVVPNFGTTQDEPVPEIGTTPVPETEPPPVPEIGTTPVPKIGTLTIPYNSTNLTVPINSISEHELLRTKFQNFYLEKKGISYSWSGKDAKHLKQLISRIKNIAGGAGDIESNFEALLRVAIQDKWIYDNLEVAIINSKWNKIIAQAKKGGQYDDIKKEFGIE